MTPAVSDRSHKDTSAYLSLKDTALLPSPSLVDTAFTHRQAPDLNASALLQWRDRVGFTPILPFTPSRAPNNIKLPYHYSIKFRKNQWRFLLSFKLILA